MDRAFANVGVYELRPLFNGNVRYEGKAYTLDEFKRFVCEFLDCDDFYVYVYSQYPARAYCLLRTRIGFVTRRSTHVRVTMRCGYVLTISDNREREAFLTWYDDTEQRYAERRAELLVGKRSRFYLPADAPIGSGGGAKLNSKKSSSR